ncbi:MAG: outer membrane lipoprotein carrier protein LolA [Spirochaetaceae bacterium]|nr:MAG: outer membrane lipoprotein carrier protein LolA [Spirochaetaceae bacterium]
MKRILFFAVLSAITAISVFAQNPPAMENAQDIFARVSQNYAKINDLSCAIRITKNNVTQSGLLLYTNRNLLKIEFYSPAGQVLVVDRERLQIYIPSQGIILEQAFKNTKEGLLSAGGLDLLKQNYNVSFDQVGIVPLDSGSGTRVYKLHLEPPMAVSEGFKYLTLSINPETNLIRRIEAKNLKNEIITIDYENITINAGIPTGRFKIDTPHLINIYPDFLTGGEE